MMRLLAPGRQALVWLAIPEPRVYPIVAALGLYESLAHAQKYRVQTLDVGT